VACGAHHTVCVDARGLLFAWGLNANGQLGLGDTRERCSPTKVDALERCAVVSDVACGGNQTWCLGVPIAHAAKGKDSEEANGRRQVFTWGQAVLNGFANDQHTPGEYLPALLYNSSLLSASPTHSCVVDRDNNLRSIGANTHGELGSGTEKKCSLLTAKLPCQRVLAVAAGSGFSVVVLEGKLGDAGSVPDGRAVFDPVADERLAAERLRYPRRARARQH